MQNIEQELLRLRAVLQHMQILQPEQVGQNSPDETERSAFKFDGDRASRPRRPSLPDPLLLEKIARNRRKRSDHFGTGLFADPAWDMIIDLAIAKARYARVSVTSLCIASGVPSTTALRWIGILIEQGLFQREDDATDKRRAFISLTDGGVRKVAKYFNEMESNSLAII